MTIDKAKYYHIHTYQDKPSFVLGQKLKWDSNTPNKFWEFYLSSSIRYPHEPYQGKYAAQLANIHLKNGQITNFELTKNVFNFLANATYEMGMLNREVIFEEYRKEHFSKLPSRRNCIWLCNGIENLKYWYNWYRNNPCQKIIYELSCTGEIHVGNQAYLNSDSMNYAEYLENAEKYWNGHDTNGKDNNETIFEGEVEVLTQIEPSFIT